jgi:cation diffusion facilitator CzcD-associated flavoprotein CzcO
MVASCAETKYSEPINTPKRNLKVICIGAGASGLLVAYKMQRNFDQFDLTIYEKNVEISGTWYENKYPGCACDVPAHIYTYSFEPKTDWKSNYASSAEIHDYFCKFADKNDLRKYVKTGHKVVGAEYSNQDAIWNVELENANGEVFEDWCHVLINCAGILNAWKWPAIPGLKGYKGTLLHSANWNESVDLQGKSVGLVGNGSSAIQILPAIVPQVSKLVTFIRSPTWICAPLDQDKRYYTEEEKKQFAEDPEFHLNTRKQLETGMHSLFGVFLKGSQEQNDMRVYARDLMMEKINDAKLEKLLIPDFSFGCRRITPGPDYLESLTNPKVEVVYGGIDHINETGVVTTDGSKHDVDVLIMATGFDTSFSPRFPLKGAHGKLLSEVWKDSPKAYMGMAVDGYPNYLMSLGPNCPVGNGSLLIPIESQVDYMMKIMAKYQKENLKSFDITSEAVDDLNEHKDNFMNSTVWNECRTWYRGAKDPTKVTALWPGSILHFLETLSCPRWEDWNFKYNRNRFEYLGNGRSTAEAYGLDMGYYLRNFDDSKPDPALKRDPTVEA